MNLPPRIMCYDADDDPNGPALDVDDVREWAFSLITMAENKQDVEAVSILKGGLQKLINHCSKPKEKR